MSTTPGSYVQIWSFHYLLLNWGLSWKQFIIFQRIRIHIRKWWVRILSVTGLFCQDKTEHHDNEGGSKLFPVVFSLRKKTRRQQIRQVITDLGVLYLNTMILHAIKTSTCYQHTFSDAALLSQSLMATLSYSHIRGCTAHFIELLWNDNNSS